MTGVPNFRRPRRVEYRGITFRSVLEARWAKTLDELGIRWQYEPGFVKLEDGRSYLPDFWLPTGVGGVWLEVKGNGNERLDKAEMWHGMGHDVVIGRMPNYGGRLWWESFPGDMWRLVRLNPEAALWTTEADGWRFVNLAGRDHEDLKLVYRESDLLQEGDVATLRLAPEQPLPRKATRR